MILYSIVQTDKSTGVAYLVILTLMTVWCKKNLNYVDSKKKVLGKDVTKNMDKNMKYCGLVA
jgi:hypothetical protein